MAKNSPPARTTNSRPRSRSYPFIPLDEAISLIQNPLADHAWPSSRDEMAKAMGYSPSSSVFARQVSALLQYGLLERQTDARLDLTRTGRTFLLKTPAEKEYHCAIQEAFHSPDLFREISRLLLRGEIRPNGKLDFEKQLKGFTNDLELTETSLPLAAEAYWTSCVLAGCISPTGSLRESISQASRVSQPEGTFGRNTTSSIDLSPSLSQVSKQWRLSLPKGRGDFVVSFSFPDDVELTHDDFDFFKVIVIELARAHFVGVTPSKASVLPFSSDKRLNDTDHG